MKDLMICVLALTWVLIVIRLMGTRRHPRETPDHIDRDFRDLVERAHHNATAVPWDRPWQGPCILHNLYNHCPEKPPDQDVPRLPFPHAHDEHGASTYSPGEIDQANRAHTTGRVRCPIHGSPCGRAKAARDTGLSQTDEDVGRRAALANGQSAH